jgi:hypothetical protein
MIILDGKLVYLVVLIYSNSKGRVSCHPLADIVSQNVTELNSRDRKSKLIKNWEDRNKEREK